MSGSLKIGLERKDFNSSIHWTRGDFACHVAPSRARDVVSMGAETNNFIPLFDAENAYVITRNG